MSSEQEELNFFDEFEKFLDDVAKLEDSKEESESVFHNGHEYHPDFPFFNHNSPISIKK